MKKVSIIIIIYKVEKYLRQCLESVVTQTYQNLEIICVVGAGDTGCEAIVDEYAGKDSRIVVIKSEPRGTADARNRGLAAVTGDYISFVDGDDHIASDMIETMITAALTSDAQISVVGTYSEYTNCTDGTDVNTQTVYSRKEAFEAILYREAFFLHLWDKMYRADLFDGIRFPEGKLVEDRQIAHKLLRRAERIVYNSAGKYYFRVSEDSGSRIEENLRMSLAADVEICDSLLKDDPTYADAVEFFLVTENLSVIQNSFLYHNFSRKHDREYLSYVRKHTPAVLKNPRVSRNHKIKMILCNLSPQLFRMFTMYRRNRFVASHIAFSSGTDWKKTFEGQKVETTV